MAKLIDILSYTLYGTIQCIPYTHLPVIFPAFCWMLLALICNTSVRFLLEGEVLFLGSVLDKYFGNLGITTVCPFIICLSSFTRNLSSKCRWQMEHLSLKILSFLGIIPDQACKSFCFTLKKLIFSSFILFFDNNPTYIPARNT